MIFIGHVRNIVAGKFTVHTTTVGTVSFASVSLVSLFISSLLFNNSLLDLLWSGFVVWSRLRRILRTNSLRELVVELCVVKPFAS